MNMPRVSWLTMLCVLACASILCRAQTQPSTGPSAPRKAVLIPLSGEVNDYSRDALFRRFDEARAMGAKVVILRIDTYGGLVTSGMDISRYLRDQSDIHTIAYVKTKAISAGAMVALACDEIIMSPGGQLGDCAPIVFDAGGKLDPMPAAERAKAQSPVLADFAASARRNGYDPLVAEAMVRVETTVHVMQNGNGEKRFVGDADAARLAAEGWKPYPGFSDPVDGPESLLTVDPEKADLLGLSKATRSNVEDIASDRHLDLVADLSPTAGDRIVGFLGNPWIRFLLLTIFIQALSVSLHAPGHGAAEATALLSLGLLLGVPLLEGYAQWWEILLIFAGLALCAFEIFVFPGHGVSLIAGIIMVVFGLVMTFVGKEPAGTPGWLPTMQQSWLGVQHGLMVVVGGIVSSLFLSFWLRRNLTSIPYFRRLVLTEVSGGVRGVPVPTTPLIDAWPFVGTVGHAVSELKPGGTAIFAYGTDTRSTSVVSSSGFIPPGSPVTVEEVRGSRVVVRKL